MTFGRLNAQAMFRVPRQVGNLLQPQNLPRGPVRCLIGALHLGQTASACLSAAEAEFDRAAREDLFLFRATG